MPVEFPITREQQITLPGAVGELEGITTAPEQSDINATVIICHPHPLYDGTMNNKVVYTLARSFDQLGLHTVRFNFRGVGKSAGAYGDGIGETEDVLALIEWVKTARPDDDIWLAGFSFGGYTAARAANLDASIKQLILIAPGVEHFDFYELKDIRAPIFLVQGCADEVVSPRLVFEWVKKSGYEIDVVRLPETSHFFHHRLVDLKQIIFKKFGKGAI